MDSRTPSTLLFHTIFWAIASPAFAGGMLWATYEAIQTGRVLSKHGSCTSGSFCYLAGVVVFVTGAAIATLLFIFMLSRLIKNEYTKTEYGSRLKNDFLSENMVMKTCFMGITAIVIALCIGIKQLCDLVS